MAITDIIPWGRARRDPSEGRDSADPVQALQTEINQAFDGFWRFFDLPSAVALVEGGTSAAAPPVDIRESDKEIEVTAELPGLEEADIDVRVADGLLTISGERKAEREVQEQGYVLRERGFGRVERILALPSGLDPDSAKATFRNGVLSVAIPKSSKAAAAFKRIPVQGH